MTEDEKMRRETMTEAVAGVVEQFRTKTLGFKTRVNAKAPADPIAQPMFQAAFQGIGDTYPADDAKPLRSDVLAEACAQLDRVGLHRFDGEDGTDYAESLVDAYFAARANYLAQSSDVVGNA